jgi:hypothetical protein
MSPVTKKRIFNALRLGICTVGIVYIVRQLSGHDLASLVGQMDGKLTILALLMFAPVVPLGGIRFRIIMATQDVRLTTWEAIKLTYAGAFLNFALPGMTGGDLYKAYCVTRWTDKKTEAVTAVFIDRIIGLGALVLVGGGMSVIGWGLQLDVGWAAQTIGSLLIALIIGAALFFSHRFRRLVRYEAILSRLPFSSQLARIDRAVFILRNQRMRMILAFMVTMGLQSFVITSLILVAAALGMKTSPLVPYLIYLPLGNVIRAIPISLQGIGPMDGAYQLFFAEGGFGSAAQVQILALAVRLLDLIWALPGALVMLTGRELPPADMEQQMAKTPVTSEGD